MKKIKNTALALAVVAGFAGAAFATDAVENKNFANIELEKETQVATLRGKSPLHLQPEPPKLQNPINDDHKVVRDYPVQPPLIPHKIDDYQVDLKVNKCISCHDRTRTEESQAPMVSVTHFRNRDGQILAGVSGARYFCTQCHVTQVDAKPLVENTFVDMETLIDSKLNVKKH